MFLGLDLLKWTKTLGVIFGESVPYSVWVGAFDPLLTCAISSVMVTQCLVLTVTGTLNGEDRQCCMCSTGIDLCTSPIHYSR